MLKKRVNLFLSFLLGIFTSALAQAQVYGSTPRGFSDVNFVGTYIDGSLLVWGAIFLVLFAFINWLAGRTPLKDNHASRIVISLGLAVLSVYGLMRAGFDLSNILISIGFTNLGSALPMVLIGLFVVFIASMIMISGWKKGVANAIWITGLVFMIASATGMVYEQLIIFVLGAVLFVVGLILLKMAKKGKGSLLFLLLIAGIVLAIWFIMEFADWILWVLGILLGLWLLAAIIGYIRGPGNLANKYTLNIHVNGRGRTRPKPGNYQINSGKRVSISAQPSRGYQFDHFLINKQQDGRSKIKFRMTKDYDVVANFVKQGGGGPEGGNGPQKGNSRSGNRFNLVRMKGVKNLEEKLKKKKAEYEEGLKKAEKAHKEATRLGWTKAGIKPQKGESDKAHKKRARKASEKYKEWYRQYNKNVKLDKEIKKIEKRINHLKSKLK